MALFGKRTFVKFYKEFQILNQDHEYYLNIYKNLYLK